MCPPYTSHQPLAIFCTAPTPTHLLRARLHCHIGTCPSIHVSHCLEEFSPQTSPSGISYPMVGVPSMCPPPPFSHFPTSGHPCGPTFLPTWPFTACAPPCTPFCASPFLGLSPLSDFPLTSDPLLATMGNPALVQPGTVPILDLCITKSNPCGPHVAHLPSLWACTTHIAIQGSGLAGSPVAKSGTHFSSW